MATLDLLFIFMCLIRLFLFIINGEVSLFSNKNDKINKSVVLAK
jgi:hypothetical protein